MFGNPFCLPNIFISRPRFSVVLADVTELYVAEMFALSVDYEAFPLAYYEEFSVVEISQLVIPFQYDSATSFDYGRATVRLNGELLRIDRTGTPVD